MEQNLCIIVNWYPSWCYYRSSGGIQKVFAKICKYNSIIIITNRGKDSGHDIDLLISHPDNSVINGLLVDFVTKLKLKVTIPFMWSIVAWIAIQFQSLMVHCDITTGNNTVSNTEMDHTNQAITKYTPDGKPK